MKLNWGFIEYRFITLYRTPEKVFWWNGPMTVDAVLPSNTGVDATVLKQQGKEIGRIIRDGFAGDGEVSPFLSTLLAGLSEISPSDPPVVERLGVMSRNTAWWIELQNRLGLGQRYHYITDLPEGYNDDANKRWPLIVYLHGGNQNGHDLDIVRDSGLARVIVKGYKVPAVVISPQAPWYEEWIPQVLEKLLDEVTAKYRVDIDRIYMTGVSGGAIGSWKMALEYPGRLAAIFPIGGDSDPEDVANLIKIPIWTFTGLQDDVIPAENVLRVVEAIRKAGGNPHVTVYPARGHDTEYLTYKTAALYTWLFAQKRGQPEVLTPGLPES
jgi:acetyl esterase/lipase